MSRVRKGFITVTDPVHGEACINVQITLDGYPATRTDPAAMWVADEEATWDESGEPLNNDEYARHEDAILAKVDALFNE